MAAGKCPSCNQTLERVEIAVLNDCSTIGEPDWRCLAFKCPGCHTVLSVQVDPGAARQDIVRELKHR